MWNFLPVTLYTLRVWVFLYKTEKEYITIAKYRALTRFIWNTSLIPYTNRIVHTNRLRTVTIYIYIYIYTYHVFCYIFKLKVLNIGDRVYIGSSWNFWSYNHTAKKLTVTKHRSHCLTYVCVCVCVCVCVFVCV